MVRLLVLAASTREGVGHPLHGEQFAGHIRAGQTTVLHEVARYKNICVHGVPHA